MFYTRIPVPSNIDHSGDVLNRATKYFPLIGWIVGGVGAIVYLVADGVLPTSLAILLSMVSTVWLTGAFHEDGWGDFCDGFGGGWGKEQILKIMKDSRAGAYAIVGLALLLLTKFIALAEIQYHLAWIIWIGHSLSRLGSTWVIYTSEYAREDAQSKAKPIAKGMPSQDFVIALIWGLGPLLMMGQILYFLLLIPLGLTAWRMRAWFEQKLGGYTGDCLGALQQLGEVIVYISVVIIEYNLLSHI